MANRQPARASQARDRRPRDTDILDCSSAWGAAGALAAGGLTLISMIGKAATSSPSEVMSAAARRASATSGTPFR